MQDRHLPHLLDGLRPARRWSRVATGLLVVALLPLLGCQAESRARLALPKPEQIVLISIDALRADYLVPRREGWGHTPNLDRFAEESVVFSDALTTWPDTSASHKSLLYGLYHHAHQTSYAGYPATERVDSPAAVLRDAGLSTAAFFSIGRIARELGFHYGFEQFDAKGRRQEPETELPELQRLAAAWLKRHVDSPFFLFLHTYQAHAPYHPPADLLEEAMARHGPFDALPEGFPPPARPRPSIRWWRQDLTPEKIRLLRTVYEGEVAAVDRWFGELVGELKRLGIYERAVIIVTSDHGEALGEDGHVGHSRLGEEQVRVPLLVRVPGTLPRRSDSPVSLVDIMPTLFDLLGLDAPYPFQGESLVGVLSDRGELPDERLRPVENTHRIALYRGEWRLHFDRTRGDSERLYRLTPGGPVAVSLTDHGRELGDIMRRYAALIREAESTAAHFQVDPEAPTRYTEETLEQLRHLGYL